MRAFLAVSLLAVTASAQHQRDQLRVNNRLHPDGPTAGSAEFFRRQSAVVTNPEGPPTIGETQRVLANNPGMHMINKKVMNNVFSGLDNEVVCTFCLLQVISLAYELGNGSVRAEISRALASPQPGELGDTLLWAASAENETLAGTLLGYYQKDQPPTCADKPQRTRQPFDTERCQQIKDLIEDIGKPLDFAQPSATDQINAAVSQATGGRILDLFPPLARSTRLVLVSALVFGANWRSRMATSRGIFHGSRGDVQTELLLLREEIPVLDGSKTDGVIGISLEYEQPGVHMFVFTTTDGTDVRQRLNQSHYERLGRTRLGRYTRVTLPSFEIESKKSSYVDMVKEMGMGAMFSGGMGGDDTLKVDKLEHKAVIKTDKDGTQAAGAAGVAVVALSAKPQPFQARFDRPFVCSLVFAELGVPIFTAYVADPQVK